MQIGKYQASSVSYVPLESFGVETINGYLSVVKQQFGNEVVCTEDDLKKLCADTATLAKLVVESKDLIKFYAPYHLIPDASMLLSIPDFFGANAKHSITLKILEYHKQYGVPRVEWFFNSAMPVVDGAEPPQCWLDKYNKTEMLKDNAEVDFAGNEVALVEEQAYPIVLTLAFLCDFYNRFIEINEESAFDLGLLHLSISFEQRFYVENGQCVFMSTAPGYWNAAYVAALVFAMGGEPIGICKKCMHGFIKSRPNVEYCSQKCRNAFNVKKSVEKHKLQLETLKKGITTSVASL